MSYYYVVWKTVYGSVTERMKCRESEPSREHVHCEQYLERENAEARADFVRNVIGCEPTIEYPEDESHNLSCGFSQES